MSHAVCVLFLMLCMCSCFAAAPLALAQRPEVQSVHILDDVVEVRSSGLSLVYFGPFQSPPGIVDERIHQFRFRIPKNPQAASGVHTSVRPDIVGVFLNGVPIYNAFEGDSYQSRGIWQFDTIARNDDGSWTYAGVPRKDLIHTFDPGVL